MRRVFAVIVSFVMAFILPVSTYAISESKLNFFAQNNILFYDPGGCNFLEEGIYNGVSTTGLSDLQASFVDRYYSIAATLSVEYGIPWEAVMAQGILESASGTSNFAVQRNNFFGIGAYDSNTNAAYRYDTPELGWKGYYDNIVATSVYRNNGVFQDLAVTDPYVYIQRIKQAGYASDPNYVEKVSKLIKAIEERTSVNDWYSSAQLASIHPEMLNNAAANAIGASSDVSAGSGIGSLQVVCNGYIGSGSLVAGGMTLQEARSFMQQYRSITPRSYHEVGGNILSRWKINDVKSCASDLENCVAFVQYFICEYGGVCMGLPDGREVVNKLLNSGNGFINGGTVPKVYAVFSTTRPTAGTRTGNHTGVILGIDTERNKIVVGEAGCGSSFDFTTAHEYNLSDFTDGSHIYAYTDGLIGF